MQNVGVSASPNGTANTTSYLSNSASTSSLRASVRGQPPPSVTQAAPPPEIEATISRLSAYRDVRGVLILATSGGIIQSSGSAFEGESGRRYAKSVKMMVEAVRSGVGEADEGDDVKFMRIRTQRHELIITPDKRYILVVLQDPS